MSRVIVTGATGFIGHHLVERLRNRGDHVTCLIRPSSDTRRLQHLSKRFIFADVTDWQSVSRALKDCDVVYHLAGLTKSLRQSQLQHVNETGVHNVARACAQMDSPPVLIVVSSLAAAGPSRPNRPRVEEDDVSPISFYGQSKLAGEIAAANYAAHVPITIVRPPIVLGEGDQNGLSLFRAIAKWGVHLTPTRMDYRYSIIHAGDLAAAMISLAERGKRLVCDNAPDGCYFVAADETPTYAELGDLIGKALGRQHVQVIHIPSSVVCGMAAANELFSHICRHPHIFNLDKAREAAAGSWTCAATAIKRDVGFAPEHPLAHRISQTVQWYINHGWLQSPRRNPRNVRPFLR